MSLAAGYQRTVELLAEPTTQQEQAFLLGLRTAIARWISEVVRSLPAPDDETWTVSFHPHRPTVRVHFARFTHDPYLPVEDGGFVGVDPDSDEPVLSRFQT